MKKGFTLIELMIIISIIGIVAAVSIPMCQDIKNRDVPITLKNCIEILEINSNENYVSYKTSKGHIRTIDKAIYSYTKFQCGTSTEEF